MHYYITPVSDSYHESAQLIQVACSDARSSEYYLVRSCLCYIHVVVKLNWEYSSTSRLYSQWLKRVVQLNGNIITPFQFRTHSKNRTPSTARLFSCNFIRVSY